jgi:ATP-dependent Clp protease adapter protein ClpS|mmetsp:Transcript_1330/g.2381  ORF Transcript_1330/g.2381 Transcript_1330/m.2381 type:complete len:182 (-) Transcript_1330:174-719(-)|eukprot:CAMPEP_0198295464 /NCGR_PEP_ID=MMETSP1449-20131203/27749_1 /TAXON_ID=420275 /ORGANISM="Attheya septentrionalis, Strain CCMP2084" /LENGTH=181 /DNA_ID=CAMNT_0043995779 /DNA_START=95 /DNA_END=640 /DNA_ORIENTATION=+
MVRSLKIIGTVLSLVAGATSALTVPSNNAVRGSVWGASSSSFGVDRRRTALSAQHDALVMMPATLEKSPVRTGDIGGPAVLERPLADTVNKEPVKDKQHTGSEAWEVHIFNDGLNTREHVARCLVQVTGLTEIAAYQTMMQAHQNGMAVVGRWVYERAEMYHCALKDNGIHCDLVEVDEDL